LPQKPFDKDKGEKVIMSKGLQRLNLFYAHPRTVVFKVTTFPPGYPGDYGAKFQYHLPTGYDVKPYMERGWCFTESAMSGLVKDYDFIVDLGLFSGSKEHNHLESIICDCKSSRSPPMLPDEFREELSRKTFTNKVGDFEKVAKLYADAFTTEFANAKTINYSGMGWGDAEIHALCRVLASPLFSAAEVILVGNPITDDGAQALMVALSSNTTIQKIVLIDEQFKYEWNVCLSKDTTMRLREESNGRLVI